MRSWPAPALPRLPGSGFPLRLYDTATKEVRPTAPPATARMYVCGITPYDATHLGHAATYTAFDIVQRVWRDAGHDVHYVQNVTDIDDPLLERAVATGQDWRELADRETALFRADMTALRVLPPQDYIGAVESIPAVVEHVRDLLDAGAAYRLDGDVYLRVDADPRFGGVAGLDVHTMRALFAERGGDPARPGKRDPLDSLLWQGARPDEPAWDTSLGHGRPGWHIECVAIALAHLGAGFDVQGGGRDLAFPHHEICASLGHLSAGSWPFARHYVHTGMLGLDGHKMSKSRGNLVFVSRLLDDGADPSAVRLALLAHHYRDDWQWGPADLAEAHERLGRWRAAAARPAPADAAATLERMRERLADDLDTPAALRAVDRWAGQTLAGTGRAGADAGTVLADAVDALLGVDLRSW